MIVELRKRDYLILLLLAALLASILLYTYFNKHKSVSNVLEKNKANSYSSVYITNDKQASIYLSHYYNLINYDIEEAYQLLYSGIKNNMSLEQFKEFVSTRNFTSSKIQKFRYYRKKGKDFFEIYDINNNHIIFKTDGIMQYRVLLYT